MTLENEPRQDAIEITIGRIRAYASGIIDEITVEEEQVSKMPSVNIHGSVIKRRDQELASLAIRKKTVERFEDFAIKTLQELRGNSDNTPGS